MRDNLRIGISADFLTLRAGALEPTLERLVDPLPQVEYEFMSDLRQEVTPDQLQDYDAVITGGVRYTPASLRGVERLAVIARWGVGFDTVDVPACTESDILVANTPDAVRRPVAEAIVTLLLALSKRVPAKDEAVRAGRWDLRTALAGVGLAGKTVGSVGLGSIGSEMFRLLEPFDLGRKLAYDPFVPAERAAAAGVELVDLPTVFRKSDFVTINCLLNDQTREMIDAELLALMKPTAYLVNTARGPIVKEPDLIDVLANRKIAGAGLDVFWQEPLPASHPLTQLDNVILSLHNLAWTDQLFTDMSVQTCENVLAVLQGQAPENTVNKEVLERASFQSKLRSLGRRWAALA
jgi:phosphoglycerate dehydrogenase-like enzyme